MKTGMLWLDDSKKRPLEEKVRRAATYYQDKYGRAPELCFVNKQALASAVVVDRIKVQPVATVLPHHLWLGSDS